MFAVLGMFSVFSLLWDCLILISFFILCSVHKSYVPTSIPVQTVSAHKTYSVVQPVAVKTIAAPVIGHGYGYGGYGGYGAGIHGGDY